LLARREEQGSSSSFVTGDVAEGGAEADGRLEEKQQGARSSRGWRPTGAGDVAANSGGGGAMSRGGCGLAAPQWSCIR
jgi:hypothetical protein